MSGAGGGIGGSSDGAFFGTTPSWVDEAKPPGHSSQMPPAWTSWLRGVLQLKHLLYSPNLIWLAITVVVYVAFPYDLEGARRDGFVSPRVLPSSWWSSRVWINMAVMLIYYGGWEVAALRGRRKFNFRSWVSSQRVTHNLLFTTLGTLQWTAFEVIFVWLWATGRLPYVADADALATPGNVARMVLWTAAIPLWRGFHFYWVRLGVWGGGVAVVCCRVFLGDRGSTLPRFSPLARSTVSLALSISLYTTLRVHSLLALSRTYTYTHTHTHTHYYSASSPLQPPFPPRRTGYSTSRHCTASCTPCTTGTSTLSRSRGSQCTPLNTCKWQ